MVKRAETLGFSGSAKEGFQRATVMDLNQLTLFQMAKARMDHSAQRQTVLAQNVANSETPQYKPKALKPLDFRQMLSQQAAQAQQIQPVRTDPRHLPGTIPARGPYQVDQLKKTYDDTISGNKVVLEEQMLKVGRAKDEYEIALNLFRKHASMIRLALGRSQ